MQESSGLEQGPISDINNAFKEEVLPTNALELISKAFYFINDAHKDNLEIKNEALKTAFDQCCKFQNPQKSLVILKFLLEEQKEFIDQNSIEEAQNKLTATPQPKTKSNDLKSKFTRRIPSSSSLFRSRKPSESSANSIVGEENSEIQIINLLEQEKKFKSPIHKKIFLEIQEAVERIILEKNINHPTDDGARKIDTKITSNDIVGIIFYTQSTIIYRDALTTNNTYHKIIDLELKSRDQENIRRNSLKLLEAINDNSSASNQQAIKNGIEWIANHCLDTGNLLNLMDGKIKTQLLLAIKLLEPETNVDLTSIERVSENAKRKLAQELTTIDKQSQGFTSQAQSKAQYDESAVAHIMHKLVEEYKHIINEDNFNYDEIQNRFLVFLEQNPTLTLNPLVVIKDKITSYKELHKGIFPLTINKQAISEEVITQYIAAIDEAHPHSMMGRLIHEESPEIIKLLSQYLSTNPIGADDFIEKNKIKLLELEVENLGFFNNVQKIGIFDNLSTNIKNKNLEASLKQHGKTYEGEVAEILATKISELEQAKSPSTATKPGSAGGRDSFSLQNSSNSLG